MSSSQSNSEPVKLYAELNTLYWVYYFSAAVQVAYHTRKKNPDYDKRGFIIARTRWLSKNTVFDIVKSLNFNTPNPKMVYVICFNHLFDAIKNRVSINIIIDGLALIGWWVYGCDLNVLVATRQTPGPNDVTGACIVLWEVATSLCKCALKRINKVITINPEVDMCLKCYGIYQGWRLTKLQRLLCLLLLIIYN